MDGRVFLRLATFVLVVWLCSAALLPADAKTVAQADTRHWNACRRLEWKIHANMDAATRRQVNRAMTQFVRATRLRFVFAGTATDQEFAAPPVDTLVIGFDASFEATRVAGLTSLWYASADEFPKMISGARVALNPRVRSAARFGFPTLVPVILHELGHAAGLDHVDDPKNLMYPYVVNVRSYRPRDIELLRRQSGSELCSVGSAGFTR